MEEAGSTSQRKGSQRKGPAGRLPEQIVKAVSVGLVKPVAALSGTSAMRAAGHDQQHQPVPQDLGRSCLSGILDKTLISGPGIVPVVHGHCSRDLGVCLPVKQSGFTDRTTK